MADPVARTRSTFGPVVLVGLAAGALTAVAGDKPAVHPTGRTATSSATRLVTYDAHLPLVTALGLVVLACWGVVLVTRGRVRRGVATLGALAGAGALAAALAAWSQVPDHLRDELAQVGVTDPSLSHTAWWWAAVVGALLSLTTSALAVVQAPSWPEMGTRYDAPGSEASSERRVVAEPPEEQSGLDLWKALDEGRDPTA